METKTIVILVLVLYMVFWFKNPEKGRDYIDSGIDKVQGLWDGKICTTNYDPVCGEDGTTYNNICLAQKGGMLNITLGVCT